MNKGTRITPVRIPAAIREIADAYLADRNACPLADWWSFTDLINHALVEFLAGKGRKGKRSLAEATPELRAVELPTENGQHHSRGMGG